MTQQATPRVSLLLFITLVLTLLLAACQNDAAPTAQATATPTALAVAESQPASAETAPAPTAAPDIDRGISSLAPVAEATGFPAVPQATATPFLIQNPSPPCGQLLPLVVEQDSAEFTWQIPPLPEELIPSEVIPALEFLFENPDRVSIAAYQTGYEGIGFYHNADQPRPLASVSKLVHLSAYANAIDDGTLDPNQRVEQDALDAFYLPGSDLGAHALALRSVFVDEMTLDEVMRMMIRYSDNAATDYLHYALSQREIEQEVIDLGLQNHSAICPFIGRFLAMGNPDSRLENRSTIDRYIDSPTYYGEQVMHLGDLYMQNAEFRSATEGYWGSRRFPSVSDQAYFVNALETRGTARDYATLMQRIAQGQIGSPTSNQLIRNHLSWPLDVFSNNQERYSDLGYKNGTFPGVLNAAYFATRVDETLPMVVTIFVEDLPNRTYQLWRRDLPNDALAHWLLSNPNAIHIMHILRDSAQQPTAQE